ncbi:MAG: TatD family hydrolase [Mangrovibacterium sp.]
MTKTINFHVHHPLPASYQGVVSSSIVQPFEPLAQQVYSVGLHPWDIIKVESNWLECLEKLLQHNQVVAIGECGIDHALDIPVILQTELFEDQIRLSEKYQKPLIIHAVRSYFELIYLRRKHQATQPWIIHNYNGNLQTTQQLLNYQFLFSFGTAMEKSKKNYQTIIRAIPLNRLLVETDNSHVNIELLYERGAQILGIEVTDLKEQIHQNFINLFQ